MRRSSRVILLLGIFLAVGAFIVILFFGGGGRGGATPTPPTATYVVAVVNIDQGTTITSSMVTTKSVPLGQEPSDAVTLPLDQVVGKTARQAVAQDAYVPLSAITGGTGPTDIASQLKAGEVAMSVQVDEVSGVGTLIQVGDHVDAIVAFTDDEIPVIWTVPSGVSSGVQQACSGKVVCDTGIKLNGNSVKMIIQNLRVVQTLLPAAQTTQGAAQATPGPEQPVLSNRSEVVILAMDPQQAEVLRFAQLGTAPAPITLVLRAKADETAPPVVTTGVILRTMVETYGVLPPQPVFAPLPPELRGR